MDKLKLELNSIMEKAESVENLFKLGQMAAQGGYYAFRIEDGFIVRGERYQEIDEAMLDKGIIDEPNSMTRNGFVHGTLGEREIQVLGAPLLVRQMVSAVFEAGARLPFNTVLLRDGTKLNLQDSKAMIRWINT
jgi:hypothetical protein